MRGGVVFVVDVEAVDFEGAKGAEIRGFTRAAGEEVRELRGEGGGLAVGGEGRSGLGAAEGEEDDFAGGLAGCDVLGQVRAGEEAGGSLGGGGGAGGGAGAAEVEGWVAAWAEVGGEEGEDDDVVAWGGAEIGEFDLAGRTRLAVVDCDVVGGSGVEGSA